MKIRAATAALILCTGLLGGFDIVRNGTPDVRFVFPKQPTADVIRSVDAFCLDVRNITGAGFTRSVKGKNTIEILADGRSCDAQCEAEITFPAKGVMRVRGAASGISRILSLLLEKYAGVVYVWPGVKGTHYPLSKTLSVPEKPLKYQPFFYLERSISNDDRTWLKHLGLKWNIDCQHMIPYRIIPVNQYIRNGQWPDREVFPVIKGKRLDMQKEHAKFAPTYQSDWQPCYSSEKSVREAVRNIENYLKTHPDCRSVSLSPNDGSGYCECAACTALDQRKRTPIRMFPRYKDNSNSYFHWCNRIAEEVGKKYPDVYFGTLAYREVHMAPDFKINPKLVVFLCYDFGTLQYPDIRRIFDRWFASWVKTGATLGIWEYGFGDSYFTVPRICFRMQGEQFRLMADNKFHAMFVECAASVGDGPKRFLYMKLAENPYADVKTLTRNWYEAAVGKAAAGYLARYYEFWNEFWVRKASKTAFADTRSSVYHTMTPFGPYMNGLEKGDMAYLRKIMTQMSDAAARSGTPSQKFRARVLMKAFEYIEQGVMAGFFEELNVSGTIKDAKQAVFLLQCLPKAVRAAEQRDRIAGELLADPDLKWWFGLKKLHARKMIPPSEKALSLTASFVSDPYVRIELKKIVRNRQLPIMTRQIANSILKLNQAGNLLKDDPKTAEYAKGKHVVTLPVKNGEWILRVPAEKGKYLATVTVILPKGTVPTAKTWINLRLLGRSKMNGNLLFADSPKIYPKAGSTYYIVHSVELNNPETGMLEFIVNLFFFPPGSKVILSDLSVTRL